MPGSNEYGHYSTVVSLPYHTQFLEGISMRKLISTAIFFCFVLIGASCGIRQHAVYNPEPITVHQSSNVKSAIRAALHSYEWIIEKDNPGVMVARQSRRTHMARIKISYNSKSVKIQYVDSDNLKYTVDKEGTPRIHNAYNGWIQRLERAIASRVS
jgi:hypothetical protein